MTQPARPAPVRLCRCPSLVAHLDRLATQAMRDGMVTFRADDDCGTAGRGSIPDGGSHHGVVDRGAEERPA